MMRTPYEISVGGGLGVFGGVGSYTTYGFWLDEKPSHDTPEPAYSNLLVSIPYTDVQLDFSRLDSGNTHYPSGRDMEFKLKKINTTSPNAIVTDVKNLIAWLTSLQGVTLTDTWNNRSWAGCSVIGTSTDYYRDGYEATVTVKVHSTHAKDTDGRL